MITDATFAWTTATRDGFVTEVQTAPPPDWPHDAFCPQDDLRPSPR